jgi:uncharacterized protein (TIGR02117 family)
MRSFVGKKIRLFTLRGLLAAVVVLILGVIIPTKWFYNTQADCNFPIYVSSVNNFHAELILPVDNGLFNWRQFLNLQELGTEADRYQYLSFGWGDKQFFMNAAYDPISIFDVLFLPGPSVMHVWGHSAGKPQLGNNFQLKKVNLSREEYGRLAKFIEDSFALNPDRKPVYLRTGFYRNSGFYEARGTYSALRTCNAWTAEGLRLADVNTPVWTALAPAVTFHVKCDCPE